MSKLKDFHGLIRKMWESGATDTQISDHLLMEHEVDVTRLAIYFHRKSRGMKSPPRGRARALTDPQVVRLRAAFDAGATYADLRERFGISNTTIAALLWRDDSLPKPKRPRRRRVAYRVPPEIRSQIKDDTRATSELAAIHGVNSRAIWRIRTMAL